MESPLPTDFFEWEGEMDTDRSQSSEPPRIVKIIGGVILLMFLAFVLILMGKGVMWAWNLEL